MHASTSSITLSLLLPEIVLIVLAVLLFVGGTFAHRRALWTAVTMVFFVVSAALMYRHAGQFGTAVDPTRSGPLIVDSLGGTSRWLAVALGVCFVLILARDARRSWIGEILGMVVLVFAGLMVVGWAGDLVLLFLGLELISIPTYVLLFVGRRDDDSAEAAAKYFYLSILSSAILLYGFAMLYGVTGSIHFDTMQDALARGGTAGTTPLSVGVLPVALVLVFAGLGFKIAAVPFHFYAPDVYQATTNGNAGLLAVVPKVAGIVALVRLLPVMVPAVADFGWQVALILSLLTMTIGNVCALWQNNIRRLMAYSSIAHAGYMLIGLAVAMSAGTTGTTMVYSGYAACLLYVVVYAAASLGTFAVLAHLSTFEREIHLVDDLRGLSSSRPWIAALLAVFMFSLSGIPPLAGFWGKLMLFAGALAVGDLREAGSGAGIWFVALAVIGVLNAAIAAAYYLRVVAVLYFRSAERDLPAPSVTAASIVATACAVCVFAIGVAPAGIVEHFRKVGGNVVSSAQARGPDREPLMSSRVARSHPDRENVDTHPPR